MRTRLAIVTTHPIQYYAPWFRHIASESGLEVRVFYLWNPSADSAYDPGFQRQVEWDIPLLDGYDHVFVPNESKSPGTSSFRGIYNPSLYHELRDWGPDVLLMMAYNYRGLIPFILRWHQCPMLFRGDSHRLVPHRGLVAAFKRFSLRHLFRRFSACLYVGQANKEYYVEHGIPPERLFFSPHCIDMVRFSSLRDTQHSRSSFELPVDSTIIMFAGKLQPKKRPDMLVDAFRALGDRVDVTLVIVGSGELETSLRTAAGNDARIRFLPFQNQSRMPQLLSCADVVVLPSEGSSETWGLIINEAQTLGKAVIVSDHVGCARDLVVEKDDGAPGMIFPAGSTEYLTGAMRRLADDAELRRRMGEVGRRRISEYSYHSATAGLLAAIRAVREPRS